MSWAEENVFDPPDPEERIETLQQIINGKVKDVKYCVNCRSTNIKTSKKGNEYCGELCWVEDGE